MADAPDLKARLMSSSSPALPSTADPALAGPLIQTGHLTRAVLALSVLLLGGVGAAGFVPIDGAVIAEGRVLVEGKPQSVQSREPGTVTHVAVRNGDHVSAGQLLLELDTSLARARLDIALERLAALLAEQMRLEAEADGQTTLTFTPPPLPFPTPDLGRAAIRQHAIFTARQRQIAEARDRLDQMGAQIASQLEDLEDQISATLREQDLLQADIARQTGLVEQGLARQQQLSDLQRNEAALTGRVAQLRAERTRLAGSLRDAELSFAEDQSRRAEEIARELRDTGTGIGQLTTEILSLMADLAQLQLRAPVDGIVHELTVPMAGSVVSAGEALAQILPSGRALEIEVEIPPQHIDKIHSGQQAEIQLTAFDMRGTGRLQATVLRVAPDAVISPQTGLHFYRATLQLVQDSLPEDLVLRPGMGAQVFLVTGSRSLGRWLLAPLAEPVSKALREG